MRAGLAVFELWCLMQCHCFLFSSVRLLTTVAAKTPERPVQVLGVIRCWNALLDVHSLLFKKCSPSYPLCMLIRETLQDSTSWILQRSLCRVLKIKVGVHLLSFYVNCFFMSVCERLIRIKVNTLTSDGVKFCIIWVYTSSQLLCFPLSLQPFPLIVYYFQKQHGHLQFFHWGEASRGLMEAFFGVGQYRCIFRLNVAYTSISKAI